MVKRFYDRPRFWLGLFGLLGLMVLGAVLLLISQFVCLWSWLSHDVVVRECPTGRLRQTVRVEADGLRRGQDGHVRVWALAHYTTSAADEIRQTEVRRFEPSVKLLDGQGQEVPLTFERGWSWQSRGQVRPVRLPADLPDGEYRLIATVRSALGEAQQELPLALFAPARVHVLTDRPLYEAGNTVRFRSLVLRARDLTPLDRRPGTWQVIDPEGEVLLEERAPAGAWGVCSGSFPLDRGAASGTWKVRWDSADAGGEAAFQVEPFTLPRFRVEAQPEQPFYQAGGRPVVAGRVVYASGAPVAAAVLDVEWVAHGDWPLPTEWSEPEPTGLPRRATTDEQGQFRLTLPRVPGDLQGQVTLAARLAATDPAGDRVAGGARVLLSQDAIVASGLTELEEGLVEGFNNRVYLRVTTPDGRPLTGTELSIRRAWDPGDQGLRATTDEDGVAALQLDPGPPVNMVLPPLPVRLPPPVAPVRSIGMEELFQGAPPTLAERLALDRRLASLAECVRFVPNEGQVELALRVRPSGVTEQVFAEQSPLTRCLQPLLLRTQLPPGGERLFGLTLALDSSQLPALESEDRVQPARAEPDELTAHLSAVLADSRQCLTPELPGGRWPRLLEWRTAPGTRPVQFRWLPDPSGDLTDLPPATLTCVEQRLRPFSLTEPATEQALGWLRLTVTPSSRQTAEPPEARTQLGYELKVAASQQGALVGETILRLAPGKVPPLRIRLTPVLPAPGGTVEVELLRGPGFTGSLPRKLHLIFEDGSASPAEFQEQARTSRFVLPATARGWGQVSWQNARAFLYVRGNQELALTLRSDRPQYAPGETAQVGVQTRAGEQPIRAAVGLFGVDASLEQLTTLRGPDDLAQLRPQATAVGPAFGMLEAQALTMGRIRGAHAAAAVVLRIQSIPTPAELDRTLNGRAEGSVDAVAELTDRFYQIHAELRQLVQRWEQEAPAGEQMQPARMARLWEQALVGCAARGVAVDDAYGRRLELKRLPPDLLALVDPRAVVLEGTRLPEDVEDWAAWVGRN